MHRLDRRLEIDQPQQGIGRGFDQDQVGRCLQRGGQLLRVGLIDVVDREMTEPGQMIEQPPGAAVTVVRGDDASTGLDQRGEAQCQRRQARRRDDAGGAALQGGDRLTQQVAGRVARAAVVVPGRVVQPRECVVRAQIDRGHDRRERGIGIETGAKSASELGDRRVHGCQDSAPTDHAEQ
ncbi:hypothetical protein SDC9_107219 [bioreactor metagenome]|uniref:Uncharacterized protein n=1 Tax=bioreactor metagenome TaxID=1076179 RepID=A0A645B5M2_9ZZZZ